MEQFSRAAGVADDIHDPTNDLEAARDHPSSYPPTSYPPVALNRAISRTSRRSRRRNSNRDSAHTDSSVPLPTTIGAPDDQRIRVPIQGRRSFSSAGSYGRRTPASSLRTGRDSRMTGTSSRPGSTYTTDYAASEVMPTPTYTQVPEIGPRAPTPADTIGTAHGDPDAANEARYDDDEEDEEDDGPPWDPLHPCWPHPNPHVPLSSPLAESTRVIRLQRDYRVSGDLYPQFATAYPEILEPFLAHEDFKAFIGPLNTMLKGCFDPMRKRHWVDATLGLLSGWAWGDVGLEGVKRGVRDIERWMELWNERVGKASGVQAIALRRTAFLCLDLQVPDPRGLIVSEGADALAGGQRNGAATPDPGRASTYAYSGYDTDTGTDAGGGYATTTNAPSAYGEELTTIGAPTTVGAPTTTGARTEDQRSTYAQTEGEGYGDGGSEAGATGPVSSVTPGCGTFYWGGSMAAAPPPATGTTRLPPEMPAIPGRFT